MVSNTIETEWGYYVIKDDKIYIPVINAVGKLGMILKELHLKHNINRFIFSAVLNRESLIPHLRHIVREFEEFHDKAKCYSHCIEVLYD